MLKLKAHKLSCSCSLIFLMVMALSFILIYFHPRSQLSILGQMGSLKNKNLDGFIFCTRLAANMSKQYATQHTSWATFQLAICSPQQMRCYSIIPVQQAIRQAEIHRSTHTHTHTGIDGSANQPSRLQPNPRLCGSLPQQSDSHPELYSQWSVSASIFTGNTVTISTFLSHYALTCTC